MAMTPEPHASRQAAPEKKLKLPFSRWWPLVAGAIAGIGLRLVYLGAPGKPYAAMLGSFIYFSPLLVGAVTVYMAERVKRRDFGYYVAAPFVANCVYVGGTLIIMVEGLICAIVIIPLFAMLGSVGGVAMGIVCRITNWPRRALYSLWALPLILGAVEPQLPLSSIERTVERSVLVQAPPERVWREIHDARAIRPEEVDAAWFFRIGVPLPEAGVSRDTPEGQVRTLRMGKAVHFDQVVTDWQANRYVRWVHRYSADSFPPNALDEHVVLGGHYFDVSSTAYELIPRGAQTELKVRMVYRVSTPFNWYADPLAKGMLGNLEDVILRFYQRRSEGG